MFLWRHSVQDIFSKWLLTTLTTTLGYRCFEAYFEPNMLKTMKMNAVKRVKRITIWKKILFTDLAKDAKSVASFLLLANFESESRHINTAWLPSTVRNGGLRSCFFREKFLQDNWHHKFWWVKNRLFTCYRQRQNCKFVAATFSFKYTCILKRLKEAGHCLCLILCVYAVLFWIYILSQWYLSGNA